ncbi:hypothetical protein H9P43_004225 [Blastocladiella emersonii ATCC 22665]|nr:hypothetical protein H9P43_004225 [Blastocladiella emersonii ATCC 22665]
MYNKVATATRRTASPAFAARSDAAAAAAWLVTADAKARLIEDSATVDLDYGAENEDVPLNAGSSKRASPRHHHHVRRLGFAVGLTLLGLLGLFALDRLLAPATPGTAASAGTRTLLISIDGFRAEYLSRNRTPHLASLFTASHDGFRAAHLIPSFPSITFPNHYTLVTGRYPSEHGIVSNVFFDPALNATFTYTEPATNADPRFWAAAEPLWTAVERQGRTAAVSSWPGSEAPFRGARPRYWVHYHHWTPAERVGVAMTWLDPRNATGLVRNVPDADHDDWPGLPGRKRAQWPRYPPPAATPAVPDLLAMYIPDVDQAGHAAGPDSAEVNDALARVDSALGDLFALLRAAGMWDSTNVVVVSDHGMAEAADPSSTAEADRHRLSLRRALGKFHDVVVVRDRWPIVMIDPVRMDDAPAILAQLQASPVNYTAYARDDLPDDLHFGRNARIPPIVVVPDNGFQFEDIPGEPLPTGMHGYVPSTTTDMNAIFLARGPSFSSAVSLASTHPDRAVPAFPNVEVYGLLCAALGIHPAENSGQGLAWMPATVSA